MGSGTENPFFQTVDSKKSDPMKIDSIFGKLGFDLSFIKDFQNLLKMLDGLKGLTDLNALADLLKKQFGNQFDALMKMGLDTVWASMNFLEEMGAGILNEIYASLLSQIYVPDEVFKITLQGLYRVNSDINYSNQFIRTTMIRHDMPATLEWIDSINKMTYDLKNAREAYSAARYGAFHVSDYIMKNVWNVYKEFRNVPVDPENPDAQKIRDNLILRYQEFFHSAMKFIIVYSYDNLSEDVVASFVQRYELIPSAFGENDTKFGRRVTITNDEIDIIAKFVNSGAIATLNNGVLNSRGREKIRYIEVRNTRIKWIYVYLVSETIHSTNFMIHRKLYERLKYPQMNTLTRNLNKAGDQLLKTGFGKAILDGIAAVDAAAYNYTRSVEQYLFDPKKQKYANFDDRTIPTPPPEGTATSDSAKAPTPALLNPDSVTGLDFTKYTVRMESELGANSGEISRQVYSLLSQKTYTRFDTVPTTKTVYVENEPIASSEIFYVFSQYEASGTPEEVSPENLKKVIVHYLMGRYTPDLYANLQVIYPDLASEFGEVLETHVLAKKVFNDIGFLSVDSMAEALLILVKRGIILLNGLTFEGNPVTVGNFVAWFKKTFTDKYIAGTLPSTTSTPSDQRIQQIVQSVGATTTVPIGNLVQPDTVTIQNTSNILYNNGGLTVDDLQEKMTTMEVPKKNVSDPTVNYPINDIVSIIQSAAIYYGSALANSANAYEILYVLFYRIKRDGARLTDQEMAAAGVATFSREKAHPDSISYLLPKSIGVTLGEVTAMPNDNADIPLGLLINSSVSATPSEPLGITDARLRIAEEKTASRNGNMVQNRFDVQRVALVSQAAVELTEIITDRVLNDLVDISTIKDLIVVYASEGAQLYNVTPAEILDFIKENLTELKKNQTRSKDNEQAWLDDQTNPNDFPDVQKKILELVNQIDSILKILAEIEKFNIFIRTVDKELRARVNGEKKPNEWVIAFNVDNPLPSEPVFIRKEHIPLFIYSKFFYEGKTD